MITPATEAATIVLLREGTSAPEIFMVKRARSMGFAGGMMVFPGGKVDAQDAALAADPALAPGFDALDPVDARARVAAVRETFEEAGVLVTRGPAVAEDVRREWRPRVARTEVPFVDFLRTAGHRLDPALLTPFAHWCPPENLDARRFDTRFYLAAMPDGEDALHDGEESTTSHWITAADALAQAEAGTARVIFPTKCNLHRLAVHADIAALHAHAAATPLRLMQPIIEARDGVPWITIPDDAGYPYTAELLATAFRG
jgi:8-oxo-dGTP pyrophosphatase MutT (NUDIX family)